MAVQYKTLVLGDLMTNCYIVYDDATMDAMVIDPAWDYKQIDKTLTDLGVTPVSYTHLTLPTNSRV